MFWTILLLAFLYFLNVTIIKPLSYWKNKNVPYVKPHLIFGNMTPFVFRRKSFSGVINDYYKSAKGRYIGINVFLKPTLLITDVDLIKKITIKDFDNFVDHRTFISEDIDKLFGKNLFRLKSQKWRKMRATLSPAFTGSKMRGMFVLISEIAEQFTNHFLKEVGPTETLTIELKDTFTRTANDIIATTAFGINCDSFAEKNNEFYLKGKDAFNFKGIRALKFFGYDLCPALMNLLRVKTFSDEISNFFRNIIVNNIAEREEKSIIRPDMIHLLMEARKGLLKHEANVEKDNDAGFATVEESKIGKVNQDEKLELTDDDVTAQALLFFLAGFDTISTALSHITYEITLNEDVQRKLQDEIDEAWENCKGKPTYETISKLKYMDMVVSEGIRLWPPVAILDRKCTKPYIIEPEHPNEVPVHLPINVSIWIPVYGVHRDPKYYPNPDKFDPERFSDENKNNINPFTYLPFGIGPRNCIGSRFALLEAKTLLFYLLQKFNLVIVNKTEIPLKISKIEFNLTAANGFWIGLKKRN